MSSSLWSLVSDFGDWLWSIIYQWQVLVTGGIITAILTAIQSYREKSFSWEAVKWVFGEFLVIALFQSWRERQIEVKNLRQKLDTPQLTLRLESEMSGEMDVLGTRGTIIMVAGTMTNSSQRDTSVIDSKVRFVSPRGTFIGQVVPPGSGDERFPVPGVAGSTLVLYGKEYWPRVMTPVIAGGAMSGWIWAKFDGLNMADVYGPGNSLIVEFSDVATGHGHTAIKSLDGSGRRYVNPVVPPATKHDP